MFLSKSVSLFIIGSKLEHLSSIDQKSGGGYGVRVGACEWVPRLSGGISHRDLYSTQRVEHHSTVILVSKEIALLEVSNNHAVTERQILTQETVQNRLLLSKASQCQ